VAPVGEKWIHEIKYDGYRLIAPRRTIDPTGTAAPRVNFKPFAAIYFSIAANCFWIDAAEIEKVKRIAATASKSPIVGKSRSRTNIP
jgi:hypothetical protein